LLINRVTTGQWGATFVSYEDPIMRVHTVCFVSYSAFHDLTKSLATITFDFYQLLLSYSMFLTSHFNWLQWQCSSLYFHWHTNSLQIPSMSQRRKSIW